MKQHKPIITHTEILCRAIRSVEDEIKTEKERYTGMPGADDYMERVVAELIGKLDALHKMYYIETGTKYI